MKACSILNIVEQERGMRKPSVAGRPVTDASQLV